MDMALQQESATAEEELRTLEAQHGGKWILIHKGSFVGAYGSYRAAEAEGERQFRTASFIIRMQPTKNAHSTILFDDTVHHGCAKSLIVAPWERDSGTVNVCRQFHTEEILDHVSNNKLQGNSIEEDAVNISKVVRHPKYREIAPLLLAAARNMVKRFGAKAEIEAAKRAEYCLASGKVADRTSWLLVIGAIRDMQSSVRA